MSQDANTLFHQLLSQLGTEDLYILIFLLVGVVATVAMGLVFRRLVLRSREEEVKSLQVPQPPSGLIQDTLKDTLQPSAQVQSAPLSMPPATPETFSSASPESSVPVRQPGLDSALANTKISFIGRIRTLFAGKPTISAHELEELEEILYTSDLGPQTVQRLLDAVEAKTRGGAQSFEGVRATIKSEMIDIFSSLATNSATENGVSRGPVVVHPSTEMARDGLDRLAIWNSRPAVLMIVGVNGAGKTTSIGKIARRLAQAGQKVLVAAGDTFRAAAGDQLRVWTDRAQVEIFAPEGVSEPSAVAFKACELGIQGGFDLVIIDTAGRLHTQKNLMEELKKMKRVIAKVISGAPHETLLVLDANSGQNALIQAREFHQALGVTGVVLTKLDGSAKGGVAVGLACELGLPIKLIGVGEGIDDLRRFSSEEFVDSIL